jgi:hypothetical protein
MEGVWGSMMMLFIVFPFAYYMPGQLACFGRCNSRPSTFPGSDHGRMENFWDSVEMMRNSTALMVRCSSLILRIALAIAR